MVRRIVFSSSIGNALEWFDFLVYGYFATIIAKEFFPMHDEWGGRCAAPRTLLHLIRTLCSSQSQLIELAFFMPCVLACNQPKDLTTARLELRQSRMVCAGVPAEL
jgi:hypothetical protein